MSDILGVSLSGFLILTGGLFGLAALLTGQAIADTWRPAWQAVAAALGLALGARFLSFALLGGPLLSLSGFLAAWAWLAAAALFARQATLARNMVRQYPWLYEPAGFLGWRARPGAVDIAASGAEG